MSQNSSFISELLNRRVPQILGLYIAATWMAIEIGDWITERFLLPHELTSYIFIGMIFFVPSVLLLAYQYGQKGKDPWKKTSFLVVPSNIAVSIFASYYFVQPVEATEVKTFVDETGFEQRLEVAKTQFRKKVLAFDWQNDTQDASQDWLEYGIPFMLAEDLGRSMFISSGVAFNNESMIYKMKSVGIEDGRNIPSSLQQDLANSQFYNYFLNGSFSLNGGEYEVSVEVYSSSSNKSVASSRFSGGNLLDVLDEVNDFVKHAIETPVSEADMATDLPIKEHFSNSLPAIEQITMALLEGGIRQNANKTIENINKAIELDPNFTYAYLALSRMQSLSGRGEDALKSLQNVLKHNYKFTKEEQLFF